MIVLFTEHSLSIGRKNRKLLRTKFWESDSSRHLICSQSSPQTPDIRQYLIFFTALSLLFPLGFFLLKLLDLIHPKVFHVYCQTYTRSTEHQQVPQWKWCSEECMRHRCVGLGIRWPWGSGVSIYHGIGKLGLSVSVQASLMVADGFCLYYFTLHKELTLNMRLTAEFPFNHTGCVFILLLDV